MSIWTAPSDFDAYPSYRCYVDANGMQHDSYEAACEYYGADTPAQLEAEGRYWAEIEAEEELVRGFTDALVFDADAARFLLACADKDARRAATVAAFDTDLDADCPF
jgi:hypothetical protein